MEDDELFALATYGKRLSPELAKLFNEYDLRMIDIIAELIQRKLSSNGIKAIKFCCENTLKRMEEPKVCKINK